MLPELKISLSANGLVWTDGLVGYPVLRLAAPWCSMLKNLQELHVQQHICECWRVRAAACFLPQNYVLPCSCKCRVMDLSSTIQNPWLDEILYLYYRLSDYREERFHEQRCGCLDALRAARTSFAVVLPSAFRIKSSLDKDNDSCCANAWRDSLTRGSWVQALSCEAEKHFVSQKQKFLQWRKWRRGE